MIRFILIAFHRLVLPDVTPFALRTPTAILRRQGEEKGRAKGLHEAALTGNPKRAISAPDESANYTP
jgi:hypothetical protein